MDISKHKQFLLSEIKVNNPNIKLEDLLYLINNLQDGPNEEDMEITIRKYVGEDLWLDFDENGEGIAFRDMFKQMDPKKINQLYYKLKEKFIK